MAVVLSVVAGLFGGQSRIDSLDTSETHVQSAHSALPLHGSLKFLESARLRQEKTSKSAHCSSIAVSNSQNGSEGCCRGQGTRWDRLEVALEADVGLFTTVTPIDGS